MLVQRARRYRTKHLDCCGQVNEAVFVIDCSGFVRERFFDQVNLVDELRGRVWDRHDVLADVARDLDLVDYRIVEKQHSQSRSQTLESGSKLIHNLPIK